MKAMNLSWKSMAKYFCLLVAVCGLSGAMTACGEDEDEPMNITYDNTLTMNGKKVSVKKVQIPQYSMEEESTSYSFAFDLGEENAQLRLSVGKALEGKVINLAEVMKYDHPNQAPALAKREANAREEEWMEQEKKNWYISLWGPDMEVFAGYTQGHGLESGTMMVRCTNRQTNEFEVSIQNAKFRSHGPNNTEKTGIFSLAWKGKAEIAEYL